MIVAQIGCLHGEMDRIYEKLQQWEQVNAKKIDIVLCCGDFQSLRDEGDLDALKCPQKFKKLGGFARYFSREKRAPILTLFVGGNHEASNFLRDLYYGGFVAENIYFLGYSSVIQVTKGAHTLRIGGISGIEKSHDAIRGYFEEWPYVHREKNLTSMYHIRTFEVAKLSSVQQRSKPVDFFLSHEWPTVATSHRQFQQNQGFQQLLRYKPFFKKEIQRGELGSPLLSELLERVQPRVLWCAAHLHCQYRISVPVDDGRKFVEFQSLDKPEGNKRFADVFAVQFSGPPANATPVLSKDGLTSTWDTHQNNRGGAAAQQNYQSKQQMMWVPKNKDNGQAIAASSVATSINAEEESKEESKEQPNLEQADQVVKLSYDAEWLAILSLSQEMIPLQFNAPSFSYPLLAPEAIQDKMTSMDQEQDLQIVFDPATTYNRTYSRVHPQTRIFIDKFGLDDRLFEPRQQQFQAQFQQAPHQFHNSQSEQVIAGQKRTYQESSLSAEQQESAAASGQQQAAAAATTNAVTLQSKDENEIDLDDL